MSGVIDAASWVLLAGGGVFAVIGGVGLVRMPDFYTRVHAASVTETLGAGLILLGLALQAGASLVCVKLLVIVVLIMFTSPTATHALTRAAMVQGVAPLLAEGEGEGGAPSKH